ncbi:unnamed protein product, partial [Amoebophrya sp. A25]|eukprot:GSA25T00025979001.1
MEPQDVAGVIDHLYVPEVYPVSRELQIETLAGVELGFKAKSGPSVAPVMWREGEKKMKTHQGELLFHPMTHGGLTTHRVKQCQTHPPSSLQKKNVNQDSPTTSNSSVGIQEPPTSKTRTGTSGQQATRSSRAASAGSAWNKLMGEQEMTEEDQIARAIQ